ncbi:hypothetical protein CRG98_028704 [Punica granatum]|uniref:Uncharacterized protein n=1 Tax=Punica granatum TaxID=22663 RepID=A0A2I0J596_PUNGR|nr:hypothetical protein CRG98_028704 [Punica granatum]
MISHGAKRATKANIKTRKEQSGTEDAQLHSECPNRAKPALEAPSRPNICLLGVQRTRSHTVPWPEQACRPVFPRLPRLHLSRVIPPVAQPESRDSHGRFPDSFPLITRLGAVRNDVKDPPKLESGQGVFVLSPMRGGRIIRDLFGVSVGLPVLPRPIL